MDYRNENEHIAGTIYRLIAKTVNNYHKDKSVLDSFEGYLNSLVIEDSDLGILIKDCYRIIAGFREGNFKKALHYLDLIKARDLCRLIKETVTEYKSKGKNHEDTKKSIKFLGVVLGSLKSVENKTEWFSKLIRDCHMIHDGLTINNLARVTYALDSIEKILS